MIFFLFSFYYPSESTTVMQVGEGPGLAFIAFGEGLALLTPSVLWAILFFLMLLTLGLGSMFGTLESVLTSMADIWPFKKMRREWHVGKRVVNVFDFRIIPEQVQHARKGRCTGVHVANECVFKSSL